MVLRRAGFRIAMAEKRPTWVITKKVFFDPSKNAVFLHFLKIAEKRRVSINEYRRLVKVQHFLFLLQNGSKTGFKKNIVSNLP